MLSNKGPHYFHSICLLGFFVLIENDSQQLSLSSSCSRRRICRRRRRKFGCSHLLKGKLKKFDWGSCESAVRISSPDGGRDIHMDYDDNDILRHNPQLAGEGRSKSSSLPRPYDFPKFDFDDSLQGHLKFDSLVETEVFLGIQSQEDNHWIEEFSCGSNGMEFNSTPADSCSISRRNNVWSEATSSESVEMLLNSVGQEEMMSGNAIIQDPNTCDDQGTKHVKFRSALDGNNDVVTGNLEATFPLEESVENYPHSEGPVEEELHEAIEPLPATSSAELACLSSGDLVHHAAYGKGWTSANEGSNSYGGECSNENLKELNLSDVKSTKCGAEEDSLCFTKTVDDVNSNLVPLNDPLDSRYNDRQEKHVSSGTEEEESEMLEGKSDEASIHARSVSSSCLVAKLGVVNRGDAGQRSLNNAIAIASTVGKSEMRSCQEEGRSGLFGTSLQTEKQVDVLPSTSKMNYPFEGCQDGSVVDIDRLSTHLGIGNAPDCASPEKKMSTAVQFVYIGNSDQMKGVPGAPVKNERISAIPLSSIEDNKVAIDKLDCSADANANKSPAIVVLSTAAESKQTNNVEGCHTDAGGILEEPAAPVPTCVIDSSKLVGEESSHHTKANSAETKQDMHVTKEQDENLSVNLGNVDAEHKRMLKEDQRAQSLNISKDVQANHMARHGGSGAPAEPNDLTKYEQRELGVTWLSYSDNDPKESASRIKPDTAFRTETDSVSKFEVRVSDDANQTSLAEISAVSPQSMEKSNEVRSSESSAIAANKCLDSNQSQVDLGHYDDANRTSLTEISAVCPQSMEKSNEVRSSESPAIADSKFLDSNQSQVELGHYRSWKGSANTELVSERNHELTRKAEGKKEPMQTPEVDKASCGSPTIITSSEPCPMEKDGQEQARGSEVTNKSANDIQPSSEDPKRDDTEGDDTSFTFKVTALPDTSQGESGKCWSPVPVGEKCNSSVVNEESTPSGEGKTVRTPSQKTSRKSARASDGEHAPETSKGTSERRGRRSSAKGTTKEKAKGNQAKRTSLDISSGKGDKASNTLVSTSSISNPHVQLGQMQPCGQIERGDTKVSSAVAVPTSNLPDLNTSALCSSSCPPTLFRQPFTDSQQVQLRAQIFVYGSLIQGTTPDEACMVSAFGPSDGGRTIWEPVWHAAIERVRSQKSNPSAAETPLHLQSDPRPSDAAVKQSPHSSKLLPSPANLSSCKGTPAPVVNPIIPLSSPLWSISTAFRNSLPSTGAHNGHVADCQHAATPMHSYQTPPIRNFVGHTSWPSPTCFPSAWIASPRTSTFNSTGCFQPVTMTETVKLTPGKESSGPLVSGMKHMTSSPVVLNVGPSPVYVGISPVPDQKIASSAQKHSVDAKPRKRKKGPSSDPYHVSVVSEARTEPVVTNAAGILSSPVAVPASTVLSLDAVLDMAAGDASAVFSNDGSEQTDLKTQEAVAYSEETLTEVAEAKSAAEDAAAVAAAAVKNSEDLWRQLAKQQDSGLTLEAKAKLASAAVAIAAAASVTKAAAAAAKVAYHAALQAKLMADEAFLSSKCSSIPSGDKCSTDLCDVRNATPASILKGDNITSQSNSIPAAAKEAPKRRVEAASAALKQTENLDAVVKAAELAATAVSQAGKIVAMGEPLPLSDLLEAGPEGCWRLAQLPCELAEKTFDKRKKQGGTEGTDASAKVRDDSVEKGGLKSLTQRKIHSRQRFRETLDGQVNVIDDVKGSGHNVEIDFRDEKVFEVSDSSKCSALVSESEAGPRTGNIRDDHEDAGVLHNDIIKEGSLVEVFKHEDGVKSAWYSANVLTLKDGKAFVCYNDLLSEKGSGNFCEWVPLYCEGDKAPVIRAAHPLTALQSQGARKRRRAGLRDYAWSIGDRVDVWINDCWWEGVVTEKHEKDETTLKVRFPAQGETSTVRAWNLRTSRLWTDGKWVEWSPSGGHNASEQTDEPQEKRQKMGSPAIPTKEKDKSALDVEYASGKPGESELALSTGDRVFRIGKTTNNDNKRATHKPWRTGQQKEGSRVIFGVPRPTGKKRKFMEVSKHFSTNRTDKSNENNDSVKFVKYLMPQTATGRGWKAPGRNESRERQTLTSRSRAPSSRKPTCTLPQKDGLISMTAQDGDNVTDHGNGIDNPMGDDENTSEKKTQHGFPACEETAETPLSSLLTTSRKISSSNARYERPNEGKVVLAGGKMHRIKERGLDDDSGKSVPEVTEPRRSNRRIQPTHRLLEGLQSSMVIPKLSSLSHDKGPRSHNRNVSTKRKITVG